MFSFKCLKVNHLEDPIWVKRQHKILKIITLAGSQLMQKILAMATSYQTTASCSVTAAEDSIQ